MSDLYADHKVNTNFENLEVRIKTPRDFALAAISLGLNAINEIVSLVKGKSDSSQTSNDK